ncbi:hypothetical protein GIB67_036587, partial [Kingdonia uniflora]
RTSLNEVLACTMAANETPIEVGTKENDPFREGEDDASRAPYAFESQNKIMTSSSHAVADLKTLGMITEYRKFCERLHDFHKSFIVQILCTFCGMKTKRLGYTLHTYVSPLEHRLLDFIHEIFSDGGFDVAHPS